MQHSYSLLSSICIAYVGVCDSFSEHSVHADMKLVWSHLLLHAVPYSSTTPHLPLGYLLESFVLCA
jgi:hypothetical protein